MLTGDGKELFIEFKGSLNRLYHLDLKYEDKKESNHAFYVAAQHQFTAACRMVQDALDQEDPDLVNAWSRAQKTYFEQARACANDLGMTITSRCRLVVPEGAQKQEENPFLQLMEARRRA